MSGCSLCYGLLRQASKRTRAASCGLGGRLHNMLWFEKIKTRFLFFLIETGGREQLTRMRRESGESMAGHRRSRPTPTRCAGAPVGARSRLGGRETPGARVRVERAQVRRALTARGDGCVIPRGRTPQSGRRAEGSGLIPHTSSSARDGLTQIPQSPSFPLREWGSFGMTFWLTAND